MDTHQSFRSFMENVVLPMRAANPSHRRLDGQVSGGNWEVVGLFRQNGKVWKVHADTHYEPLLIAHEAQKGGVDNPFVEQSTRQGRCLDLLPELRAKRREPQHKYLYIYEV
jgi:hypothetical protein